MGAQAWSPSRKLRHCRTVIIIISILILSIQVISVDVELHKALAGASCSLWRMSFSAAEKIIMLHTSDSSRSSCRKEVMKLLKSDLQDFKNNIAYLGGHLGVGSFQLKMAFFKLLDEQSDESFWSHENLQSAYVWTLGRIIHCLKNERVNHYFVKTVNVIDRGAWTGKYRAFIMYLENQKQTYSEGLRRS